VAFFVLAQATEAVLANGTKCVHPRGTPVQARCLHC
jgi:hypothetical protein